MLALGEDPRGNPIQWAGKPLGVDIEDAVVAHRPAGRLDGGTVADMGEQGGRQSPGEPAVPVPADLGDRAHAGAALIRGQE
jgi:hypothetical protein